MCAWRIASNVSKPLIGRDEKSAFLLNDLPKSRISPSAHLLFYYADRVIFMLAQKRDRRTRQVFVNFDSKGHLGLPRQGQKDFLPDHVCCIGERGLDRFVI